MKLLYLLPIDIIFYRVKITNENKVNLPDILKEAISIEIYGIEYYSIFSDLVDDENAKSLLRGLARDEGEHRELLEKETREVLELGIRTEKRSIELYSNSSKRMEAGESKDLFLRLAGFEEGHKKLLEDALYYLEQGGSWYGYSPPTLEG